MVFFSEAAVVQELVKLSFRPKFAQWIAFHGRRMYFFNIGLTCELTFDGLNLGAGTEEQQRSFKGLLRDS